MYRDSNLFEDMRLLHKTGVVMFSGDNEQGSILISDIYVPKRIANKYILSYNFLQKQKFKKEEWKKH